MPPKKTKQNIHNPSKDHEDTLYDLFNAIDKLAQDAEHDKFAQKVIDSAAHEFSESSEYVL